MGEARSRRRLHVYRFAPTMANAKIHLPFTYQAQQFRGERSDWLHHIKNSLYDAGDA